MQSVKALAAKWAGMGTARMSKKKSNFDPVGWVILGALAFGIYQFGIADHGATRAAAAKPQPSASAAPSKPASVPLTEPRFVNVASLNVRHTPDPSGALIMALPKGTQLRVLDRQNGWLLVDLNPTLEGWVMERLTTTQTPGQRYNPPANLKSSR